MLMMKSKTHQFHVFISSFKDGIFPDELKIPKFTPVFKSRGEVVSEETRRAPVSCS